MMTIKECGVSFILPFARNKFKSRKQIPAASISKRKEANFSSTDFNEESQFQKHTRS